MTLSPKFIFAGIAREHEALSVLCSIIDGMIIIC